MSNGIAILGADISGNLDCGFLAPIYLPTYSIRSSFTSSFNKDGIEDDTEFEDGADLIDESDDGDIVGELGIVDTFGYRK